MLDKLPLKNILFVDIETIAIAADYYQLNERMQYLWSKKMKRYTETLHPEEVEPRAAELYEQKAAIYAEFGRVVCISCGIIVEEEGKYMFRTKSCSGHDEPELLKRFADILTSFFKYDNHYICGHNIKEFDIPYLCRRFIANGIPLPKPLQLYGKKPWEIKHLIDTMAYWKFGDYKSYTSLDLLAETLGVHSPKDELDGSQVTHAYWKEDRLNDIVKYCEKDIFATANVFLKLALHDSIEIIPINAEG